METGRAARLITLTGALALLCAACDTNGSRERSDETIGPLASLCIVTGGNGVCRIVTERGGEHRGDEVSERGTPPADGSSEVIVERGVVRGKSVAGRQSVRVRVGDVVVVEGGSDNRVEVRLGTVR